LNIGIILLLSLLVEIETKLVLSLVANRKIWEDEVPSFCRTIQISHSRDGHSCQDWDKRSSWLLYTSMGDVTSCLERSKEKEVGIVRERDIFLVLAFAFIDAKLDNRRRVDWSSVRRSCKMLI
jgi:hypothetical protein